MNADVPAPRRPLALALLLAVGSAFCVYALARGWQHRQPLAVLWGIKWWLIAAGIAASAVLAAITARGLVTGRRHAPRAWPRDLFCFLVGAAVAYLIVAQPFATLTFEFALSLVAGAFALRVRFASWRPPRALELVGFNLCMAVVFLEVGLRGLAWVSPSPMLIVGDSTVAQRIDGNRPPAGTLRWGFPSNRGGHYDTEFAPRSERSGRTVAMIGDSFSAGVVPHPFHFTSVCEAQLDGVEVYNVGVSAIGPLHYLHLLRAEVAPLQPDAVVVNLFIGNDVDRYFHARSGWLHRWLDRNNVLLCVLPQRMMAVAKERSAQGLANMAVGAPQDEATLERRVEDPEELRRAFPWIDDYTMEQPTFSPERFLLIEAERAANACAGTGNNFDNVVAVIEEMHAACDGVPFGVVLIPDEFQVEDRLWSEIIAGSAAPLDRDRPQRILTDLLSDRGIPVLDLLPILRAQPLEPDGERHVYHLRNTHFNARGNRITGEAMAGFVSNLLD